MTVIICLKIEKFLWPESKIVLYLYLMLYKNNYVILFSAISPSENLGHIQSTQMIITSFANVFKEHMLENKNTEKAI